jgi:long-subunit fatty acid transport protein
VDANWTDWSKWDHLTFQFDQEIKLLQMARLYGRGDSSQLVISRGYRSVIHYGYGMEYSLLPQLKLRFGYEPRRSSIPNDKMDLIAPLPKVRIKSLGLSWSTDAGTTIDIGGSMAYGRYKVPANTSCNLNCTDFFNLIYNPYAGLNVSGETRLRYGGITIRHPF